VRIVLDPRGVPVHPSARAVTASDEAAVELALGGGEDYELCFAAPDAAVQPVRDRFEQEFQLRLSRVGRVESGEGVGVLTESGSVEPLRVRGYQHFGSDG
jgi:thiamine-monophosphate kinase